MADDVEGTRPLDPLPEAPANGAPADGGISLDGFDEMDHSVVEDQPGEAGGDAGGISLDGFNEMDHSVVEDEVPAPRPPSPPSAEAPALEVKVAPQPAPQPTPQPAREASQPRPIRISVPVTPVVETRGDRASSELEPAAGGFAPGQTTPRPAGFDPRQTTPRPVGFDPRQTTPRPRQTTGPAGARTTGSQPVRGQRETGPGEVNGARGTGPQPRHVRRTNGPGIVEEARGTGPQPRHVRRTTGPTTQRHSRPTGPEKPRPERITGAEAERPSGTSGSEILAEARRTASKLTGEELQQARDAAAAEPEVPQLKLRGGRYYSQELVAASSRINLLRLTLLMGGVLTIVGLVLVLVIQLSSKTEAPLDQLPDGQVFVVETEVARRGRDLTLVANPPCPGGLVYFNGRLMETRVTQHGRRIIITIPQRGHDGHVELECGGRRNVSRRRLVLR